jgi:ParB family chromosome partitioning protein
VALFVPDFIKMTTAKTRRLGRGLEALISAARTPASGVDSVDQAHGDLKQIPLARVRENPFQPRKTFDAKELAELEASIRDNGLLQPITVRRAPNAADGYQLVSGERRLRAATRLGWKEIPALVRDLDDKTLLTLALVENLQRADLNPLEQAEGFQKLIDDFGLTQQEVSDVVGKERSTVANMLRLLDLPASVRRLVRESQLTTGHARALLAIDNPEAMAALAKEVVAKGLSVRAVESRVREQPHRATKRRSSSQKEGHQTAEVRRIQDALRRRFQTDVRIELSAPDRGNIRIPFYSAEDFDRMLEFMLPTPQEVS